MEILPRLGRLLLVVLLLVTVAPARAQLSLSVGGVQGVGWRAEGVAVTLADAADGGLALHLEVARLQLPAAAGTWSGLRLHCANLSPVDGGYRCPAVTLEADTPYGPQRLAGSLHYRDAGHWSLQLDGLRLAGGRWRLDASADGRWRAELTGRDATPAGLLALWPGHGLPDWNWRGLLDARLQLRGDGMTPAEASLNLQLRDGGWSSPDGLQAGEALSLALKLDARRQGDAWQGRVEAESGAGQVYADPVFLALDQQPLDMAAGFGLADAGAALVLDSVQAGLGKLVAVQGAGRVPLASPRAADARLSVALPDLGAAYPVLVQPFGYGRVLGNLALAGSAQLSLNLTQGAPRLASLDLDGVQLRDGADRFGVQTLRGQLHWQAAGTPAVSRLRWEAANLYRIAVGGGRVDLLLRGDGIALTQPLDLPLLEGRLRIPRLVAEGLAGAAPTWEAALAADALSLPALSRALGWPTLAGVLSVEIPAVRYGERVLALDGALVARAFDGTVRVTDLRLREPLSPAPVFEADATLTGLDLERLTRVFDLGRITGRLEGEVRDLQLVGWQPVAFHALLQSPANDDLPHRISQRAVENLTALGNNGAVALSGTFLRFFESFSYDRLMLRVDLDGQRATLDGLPHPGGGYYLVKGAGLPRIDVIGRNREVAWRDLVERLRRIQLKGAKVR